jgi:hypothetical protein
MMIVAASGRLCGQNEPPTREWHVTLKVVDEAGASVGGAKASISYAVTPSAGQPRDSRASESITGFTDGNGGFKASHRDRSISLSLAVQKDGFYQNYVVVELGPASRREPIKWIPTVTILLKKIVQPIPMYAKKIRAAETPQIKNRTMGYDFIIGDWIAPYGKGLKADITFLDEFHGKAPYDYLSKLTVSFPNAGDGIQEFDVPYPVMQGSQLRSAHQAPPAGYQPQLIKEASAHPGQPNKPSDYDESRGYFIRVQTILDSNGNVKSALYGKIYGDFMQFTYYLNPTPNDRNMEFDPNQNLLQNLPSADQVTAP